LALREETWRFSKIDAIGELRFKNGTARNSTCASSFDLAQTEALIPPLELAESGSTQLCILAGHAARICRQLAGRPFRCPGECGPGNSRNAADGWPIVRQAEAQVAAHSARIGVAQADRDPQLGVSGFIGLRPSDLKNCSPRTARPPSSCLRFQGTF